MLLYMEGLESQLQQSHPVNSREPPMSPMIDFLSKFVEKTLLEKPRLSTHHNRDPQVSQRERLNLKSQDISNHLLDRLRSVEEKTEDLWLLIL